VRPRVGIGNRSPGTYRASLGSVEVTTFNDHATDPAAVVWTSPRPQTPSSAVQARFIARSNRRFATDDSDATVEGCRSWLNAEHGARAGSDCGRSRRTRAMVRSSRKASSCAIEGIDGADHRGQTCRCGGTGCPRRGRRPVDRSAARGSRFGVAGMINVPSGARVLLVTRPIDFRKGAHGLADAIAGVAAVMRGAARQLGRVSGST
jgi:hypothetical protein